MQILVAHPVLGSQQLWGWGPAVCVLTSGQWCSCYSLRTTALNNHQWTHGFQLLESSLHFCNLNLILSFKDISLPNFYIFDLVSKLFFQSHIIPLKGKWRVRQWCSRSQVETREAPFLHSGLLWFGRLFWLEQWEMGKWDQLKNPPSSSLLTVQESKIVGLTETLLVLYISWWFQFFKTSDQFLWTPRNCGKL